ncbi:MAG: PEGA domain-containing protein [Actinomycetota bacterium]
MNRRVLSLVGALATLASSAPAFAQGGRGAGRAGGEAPRIGGMARPRATNGARIPGAARVPRSRAGRGDGAPGARPDRRSGSPRAQRHRDRNGDGRPDRHRHHRPRVWWPFFGGLGLSPYGYRSPFYDPFYSGFYDYGALERDAEVDKNVTVRVKPENARVLVNGLLYSGRGKTSFDLPVGQWTVELSAPGYRTEVIALNVEQGVRYRIERKLEKDATQDPRGKTLKVEELPPR